jgi:hypothetical protein
MSNTAKSYCDVHEALAIDCLVAYYGGLVVLRSYTFG